MNDPMRESRLRGTDSFPFVLYHLDFTPLTGEFHWQEDTEFLMPTEGALDLTLDGQSIFLEKGQIVAINPGQLHGFKGIWGNDECDVLIFSWKNLLFNIEDHDQRKFLQPLAESRLGLPQNVEPIREQIQQIVKLFRQENSGHRPPAFELEVKTLLLEIAIVLAKKNAFIPLRPTKQRDVCKEIVTYVRQHYTERITIPEVAAAVGISPTYFSTFFSQHFFTNFSNYLLSFRLERATALLAATDMTVTNIALATGFGSGSHFIRHFREERGITPKEFRNSR